jgi:hypothetical protein
MKKLLFTLLTISCFATIKAQENQPADDGIRQEKIQALYVAYVTKELNLTSEDAQKFWPVHMQFENEMKAVKADLPELDKEQAKLNIKKKYQPNFTSILGAPRCERFFKLNQAFKKKLMERLKNRRQNGGMRQGGGGIRRGQ